MWHVHTDEKKNKSNSGMCFHGPTGPTSPKKKGPTGPSRIEEKRNEKRDIPVKNGIPQIRTDKWSTVFGPVSVYSVPFSVPFPFIPEKTKTDGKKRYTVADETGFIPSVFILNSYTIYRIYIVACSSCTHMETLVYEHTSQVNACKRVMGKQIPVHTCTLHTPGTMFR
jgi:hypothetical protein